MVANNPARHGLPITLSLSLPLRLPLPLLLVCLLWIVWTLHRFDAALPGVAVCHG